MDLFHAERDGERTSRPAALRRGANARGPGRRFAVVTWDLSNNCAGRAFILAEMLARIGDVTLIGPTRRCDGYDVWPPITTSPIQTKLLDGSTFARLRNSVAEHADLHRYDLVVASKARFASVYAGLALAVASKCPMILDIDEDEMAFMEEAPPSLPSLEALSDCIRNGPEEPVDSFVFTAIAQHFAERLPHKTAASEILAKPHRCRIIRHARDETVWNPRRFNRNAERRSRGYAKTDFVIMFLGTPRAHKGLIALDEALRQLDDSRLVLHILGASPQQRRDFLPALQYKNLRIDGYVHWRDAPRALACADLVCIIQDTDFAIASTQTPAKVTDALAMNVPILANWTPPLEELASLGALRIIEDHALAGAIRTAASGSGSKIRTERVFREHFSYRVNSRRLQDSIREAERAPGALAELLADMNAYCLGRDAPPQRRPSSGGDGLG
jgi:glycosyltransferase involved in cell wall biosynthesis